jgi:secreted PhoX family phosphatase
MLPTRQRFIHAGSLAATGAGLGMSRVKRAHAADIGPYGPLLPPNADGVSLPAGFAARIVAVTGEFVRGTSYAWHVAPDGGATFAVPNGWIYVSNSEDSGNTGGVGAIRFAQSGEIVDAYRILTDTRWNCAGGATPWGTWLSCEEYCAGLVWECDPYGPGQGVARPALGTFVHEAAAVDPATGYVYLTEDENRGRFYRFRPRAYGDLRSGRLEAASVATSGHVQWVPVSPAKPYRGSDTSAFDKGEGAWFDVDRSTVFFTTTTDSRVWALNTQADVLRIVYDAADGSRLREPHNVTVHGQTSLVLVAEDADDLQLVLLAEEDGEWSPSPFLQLHGHDSSEIVGPAFNPDGTHLYFSSQRGTDGKTGITFEVVGPF